MALSRKRALYVDVATTYGTDDDQDGSDYLAIPCLDIGDLSEDKAPIPTNYRTGRQWDTAPIAGPDGWSFSFSTPVIGLLTAAGDTVNASAKTNDWLDLLLTHIFGTQATTIGDAIASIPDTAGFVSTAVNYVAQDLIPLWENDVPTAGLEATQWTLVTAANGSYDHDVAPVFSAALTGAAVAYGAKEYRLSDTGGSSLNFAYVEDGTTYTLTGGRITSFGFDGEAGQPVKLNFSVSGDISLAGAKASLPAALAAPALTPIMATLSPVWFNGTAYATSKFTFDMGLETSVQASTSAVNGRAEYTNVRCNPSLEIEPLWTTAILDLQRNATKGRVLLQLGAGQFASLILNTCALHFEEAVAETVTRSDENGRSRLTVKFKCTDKRYLTGVVAAQFMQFARA